MMSSAAQPPQILQIHREALKPGQEAEYARIEDDTARLCASLGCPHPYLGLESLTGPKEAWFFNGYGSVAEQLQVVEDYARNVPLMAALQANRARKAGLTGTAVNLFVDYLRDSSQGPAWTMGQGRFLVVAMGRSEPRFEGTLFEAADGTRMAIAPADSRSDADAGAALGGPDARVFAVRPTWSYPHQDWIAADLPFWRPAFRSDPKV